jgi:hypothetical protein
MAVLRHLPEAPLTHRNGKRGRGVRAKRRQPITRNPYEWTWPPFGVAGCSGHEEVLAHSPGQLRPAPPGTAAQSPTRAHRWPGTNPPMPRRPRRAAHRVRGLPANALACLLLRKQGVLATVGSAPARSRHRTAAATGRETRSGPVPASAARIPRGDGRRASRHRRNRARYGRGPSVPPDRA